MKNRPVWKEEKVNTYKVKNYIINTLFARNGFKYLFMERSGQKSLIENYSPFITIEMGQNAPKPVLHDT